MRDSSKGLIIVEGDDDEKFLDKYLKEIGFDDRFDLMKSDGNGGLNDRIPDIRERLDGDDDSKTAVIYDANGSHADSKLKIEKTLNNAGLKGQVKIFLFPNDADAGELEDLLKDLINPTYSDILDCFAKYKKCLADNGRTLSEKRYKGATIFTFREVTGQDTKEREYNMEFWDFENPAAEPLKKFLTNL